MSIDQLPGIPNEAAQGGTHNAIPGDTGWYDGTFDGTLFEPQSVTTGRPFSTQGDYRYRAGMDERGNGDDADRIAAADSLNQTLPHAIPDINPSADPTADTDLGAPKERPAQSFTIDFLEDGDVESARRVSQLVNDPRNRSAFVSPYPTVEEDPECEAIFKEVNKPDKKLALFRDAEGVIRGHAQLSLHPDRADMVSWYLGVLDPEIQDQNIGPIFIHELANATFNAEWPPDRTGNPRNIQLIEIHVILNENNHPTNFSNVTRKKFPAAYRLMRKLSDFVDETAYYPPHIRTVLADGRVVYLPVAVFTILQENFDAFKKRKADGDLD